LNSNLTLHYSASLDTKCTAESTNPLTCFFILHFILWWLLSIHDVIMKTIFLVVAKSIFSINYPTGNACQEFFLTNVQFLYTIDVKWLFNSASIASKCFYKTEFMPGIYYYKNSIFTLTVDDYTCLDTMYECLNNTVGTVPVYTIYDENLQNIYCVRSQSNNIRVSTSGL